MEEPIHVGLLYGGRSPEHEVSVDSAGNVFEALSANGRHRVTPIYIGRDGRWHVEDPGEAALRNPEADPLGPGGGRRTLLAPAEDGASVSVDGANGDAAANGAAALEPLGLDVVFPILHGPNGEDGRVQGLLDTLGLPYVGAGVVGSSVCMDKEVAKRLLRDAGLPVVPFRVLRYGGDGIPFSEVEDALGAPFFVKPANAGSSVGASKVADASEYDEAVETAFEFDNKILIETAIDGREIECAVMGNEDPRAAGPGEIVSEAEFYTYDAKYDDELDAARMEVPADLPEKLAERLRALAVRTYRLLGCEGFARVDFFVIEGDAADGHASEEAVDAAGHDLFLNEVNTIPGFTARSMFPVMWEDEGLDAAELAAELVRLALARHERDARLKMTL